MNNYIVIKNFMPDNSGIKKSIAKLIDKFHDSKVICLFSLDAMHTVKHHHAFGNYNWICVKSSTGTVAAPDAELHCSRCLLRLWI